MSRCGGLTSAGPTSRTNTAYADQPQAATMPSDTSVSIEVKPCLAAFSAAAWNGQAAHPATGTASATRTHCQPGNRNEWTSDNCTETSLSGTKNTRATISRRLSYTTLAASPASAADPTPPTSAGDADSS